MGGRGRPGQRWPEWLWKTVDVHGTDGSVIVAVVVVARAAVDCDAVGPTSRGRVIKRVSPLRLLGWPRCLVPVPRPRLALGHAGGRGEAHRRQTCAGARIVASPGGQPQPVARYGHWRLAAVLTSTHLEAAAAPLTQRPPVQRVKLAGDGRGRLASVELLGA